MSLLDTPAKGVAGVKSFIQSPFGGRSVNNPSPLPDYPDGFVIEELLDAGRDNNYVRLVGNMMPKIPFKWGGTQRLQKDHYPGNNEPVVHILGSDEDDVVINGRLYDKRYKNPDLRGVANEVREQIDAIRKGGKLVRISLGEWRRYGFLSHAVFSEKTLADIEYEITFTILGEKKPVNFSVITTGKDVPTEINNKLIAEATAFQTNYAANRVADLSIPTSIADYLNLATSGIASAVKLVTDLTDEIVAQGQDISNSITRAVGLTKYARNKVLQYRLQIARISYQLGFSGVNVPRKYGAANLISKVQSDAMSMQLLMAELLKRFQELAKTVPMARYRVIQTDTLQKISVRFYGTADNWKSIYDHNKLTTTALTSGRVLEIPKL